MRWHNVIVMILSGVLVAGCSVSKAEQPKNRDAGEVIISQDQAAGELPCFKCHSFEKFSAKPEKGVFTHKQHVSTGFHCNQCHDFEGHKHITINRDVCANCHNMKTVQFSKTTMPASFSHEVHATRFGCKECHPNLFSMKTGTAHITMQGMNKGEYCGACHNGKKAFSPSDCAKCHKKMTAFDRELVYNLEGVGNVAFSHKMHTGAFSCDNCHPKLFAMKKTHGKMKMDAMNAGKYCGGCHNGNVATSVTECDKCHKQT
jgi:c(7)-type cytochrome triheme protein